MERTNSQACTQVAENSRLTKDARRYGLFAGLALGIVSGLSCCWLLGSFHRVLPIASFGAVVGMAWGFAVAAHRTRGLTDSRLPDIAPLIGATLGLVPSVLILGRGIQFLRGNLTLLLVLGISLTPAIVGMLIGGMMDRFYERRYQGLVNLGDSLPADV